MQHASKGKDGSHAVMRTATNETYPIQEASYWGIGSRLPIMGTVCNILQELKINHYCFEQMHNC
ncbi:hypothetical protein SLEP1_g25916 [Rubroshorea leprosula]|uniref:Uncharacterized protein n=1 Tax=Rubroshorea leprosula TaxID=152421 RepID=A0AAV5JW52_9ROSI|nr:hypothetical protein SLEP1_g25916 [Rubroshorea leprosula]